MEQTPESHRDQRLAKLREIRARGIDPYPAHCERTHTASEALASFVVPSADGGLADATPPPRVRVAGRIVGGIRGHGKTVFCHLRDATGRIQLYFKLDTLGQERFDLLRLLDIADFLEAEGPLFRTRTGEVTVEVQNFRLLAKALRPPPEKWHGLSDVETRYRQRYLDLLANDEAREAFITRSRVVSAARRYFDSRGFIEVETPVLQPVYGGAAARPFETYHNTLDQRLFLRIATELYLKRLIVGGLDKVYEIGKNFRNEGISTRHNPEFTVLESYEAYADYEDVMRLLEELVCVVARDVLGSEHVAFQGNDIALAPPWRRISVRDAIREYAGIDYEDYPDQTSLLGRSREVGLTIAGDAPRGKIIDELRDQFVEHNLIQPTILVDYPAEVSPLAKGIPGRPELVQRFEAYIGGMEVANAYSELNDPIDQRARLEGQVRERAKGDQEAHPMDEDYITALEHGMPPTGGLGVGIDRLAMLFADTPSIREVILFPQLRSKT